MSIHRSGFYYRYCHLDIDSVDVYHYVIREKPEYLIIYQFNQDYDIVILTKINTLPLTYAKIFILIDHGVDYQIVLGQDIDDLEGFFNFPVNTYYDIQTVNNIVSFRKNCHHYNPNYTHSFTKKYINHILTLDNDIKLIYSLLNVEIDYQVSRGNFNLYELNKMVKMLTILTHDHIKENDYLPYFDTLLMYYEN